MSPLGDPMETAPAFRSFEPIPQKDRVFPNFSTLLTNTNNTAEVLPEEGRELNFRLTVRDNNIDGGGFTYENFKIDIENEAGPFEVLNYNFGSRTFNASDTVPLFWSVNNTDQSPVSVSQVNILLSTDGGLTYPDTLMKNTENDGEAQLTLPQFDEDKTACRFMVEAVGNVFFNINRADFTILRGLVSTENIGDSKRIDLFPNPANSYITIRSQDLNLNNANVKVYNAQGQFLMESNIFNSDNKILISDLSSGIYFLKIQIENTIFTKRFNIFH